jgi:hypothetical protein
MKVLLVGPFRYLHILDYCSTTNLYYAWNLNKAKRYVHNTNVLLK